MNLTSTNIANRLLLAKCCYADYAIDYLQKRNIGDNEQASCYLSKMKQLYYSMQALCQYVPASELAPTASLSINLFTASFSGTIQLTVDDEAVSDEETFSSASVGTQVITMINSVNLYQSDYILSYDSDTQTVILTSTQTGTSDNGNIANIVKNGVSGNGQAMAGGTDQWCLDDTKAQKILDNIDQLCGCPCDCDSSILTDTIPRYIN